MHRSLLGMAIFCSSLSLNTLRHHDTQAKGGKATFFQIMTLTPKMENLLLLPNENYCRFEA
jgi:hypothetical protein